MRQHTSNKHLYSCTQIQEPFFALCTVFCYIESGLCHQCILGESPSSDSVTLMFFSEDSSHLHQSGGAHFCGGAFVT